MATFIRNAAGIRHVLKDLDGPVGQHITKLAKRTTTLAKRQVGVDTGDLRSSIGYSVFLRGHVTALIGSDSKIALLHHEGTSPHIIRPKGKALKFSNKSGKVIYTKIVHHPGTRPNKYLTDSLSSAVG